MSRFNARSSPRCVLDRPASASYLAAAERLYSSQPEYLSDCTRYNAVGCLALSLNLGEVVDSWDWGDRGSDRDAQGRLAFDVCSAVLARYKHMLVGPSSSPHRSQWSRVTWLHMVVRPGEEAQNWLVATAQAQALDVEVQGRAVAVPARPVAARLPPGHVQVVFRGVPFYYSRPGFTAAVLGAAAYGLEQGVVVVHERAGLVHGPSGEKLGAPSLDVVVAVVRAPEGDPALQFLPASFCLGQQVVSVEVQGCVAQGLHFSLRVEAPAAGPRSHREGALTRVYEQHGITPAVLAAAPPLLADVVGQRAQRPGSQAGLGFAQAGGRAPGPCFVRAQPAAPPPPPPPRPAAEFPLHDAEPLLLPPLDEPVFGAAMEYILDCCDGISEQDAQRVVMAVRQFHPETYAASRGTSSMSGLAPPFRLVLASQAAGILGEELAAVLCPAGGAGEGEPGGEEEGAVPLDSEDGVREMGLGAGRAAAACLPTSVLTMVGSDGEEAVGVDVMEADGSPRAVGLPAVGNKEPATVPTPPTTSEPSVARGGGKGKQRQGTQGAMPRTSPYPQRPGRMQGGNTHWLEGSPAASRQRAGTDSVVQDAAGQQHNSKAKAARSPPDMGSGCQRQ